MLTFDDQDRLRLDYGALRRLRVQRGLSITRLAAMIDRAASCVSQYERGVAAPSLKSLLRICVALDCGPDDLIMPVEEVKSKPHKQQRRAS
jgi:transcriptional regulator with XRE-family HTH domain